MTKYYALDNENWEWTEYDTLDEALAEAQANIEYCREMCDPEWPLGVTEIYVLSGERDPEIDEDGFGGCKIIYRATEVDRQELDPEDAEACGYNYTCDYRMLPVQ
jgi:hypothetical protein